MNLTSVVKRSEMFNARKLVLARKRRKLTAKRLSECSGVSQVTLSRIEQSRNSPDETTIDALASALQYPRNFFFGDDIDELPSESASFRSLSSMTARERDAALAAGQIAFMFKDWVSTQFNLPEIKISNMSDLYSPEGAARTLREQWLLGEKPIGHVIKLLEAKGARVFSLAENTKTVDAFSCWRNEEPYIFLNTFKSIEHRRFDAAHELGHLVLHRHGGTGDSHGCKGDTRQAEHEANRFASEFLMPEHDVRAQLPVVKSVSQLIRAKSRWGVSVMALVYRLHKMGILTDWQYRRFCIQASRLGYRNAEPNPLADETSVVWTKVFRELWGSRFTKDDLANELELPLSEIENLVFGLISLMPREAKENFSASNKVTLQVVRNNT